MRQGDDNNTWGKHNELLSNLRVRMYMCRIVCNTEPFKEYGCMKNRNTKENKRNMNDTKRNNRIHRR